MNKKRWIGVLLLTVSPLVLALDFGDIVTDVITKGNISTKNILGAIKSITNVTSGQVVGEVPKGGEGAVVLYSTEWCGYCKQAISDMDDKKIPYINKDIEGKAEYQKLGGTGGVPFFLFGEKTMSGFSAASFDKHYADFQIAHPPKVGAENEAVLKSGDVLKGKIAGVQVYKQPEKSSSKLVRIGKTDEVIFMGEEKEGFYLVTTSTGQGWVEKILVEK